MTASENNQLLERVRELEAELLAIKQRLNDDSALGSPAAPSSGSSRVATPPPLPTRPSAGPLPTQANHRPEVAAPQASALSWRPELWVGRVGVVLLVLGVLFFFQYAVEQGWIGPWMRIGAGVVLGAVMVLGAGRVSRVGSWFACLLSGGGLAVWFACAIASSRMYELVPAWVAFMVTLLLAGVGYVMSLRQQSRALAFLALLGGLGSPLILLDGASSSWFEWLGGLGVSLAGLALYVKRGGAEIPALVFFLCGALIASGGSADGSIWQGTGLTTGWGIWAGALMAAAWFRMARTYEGAEAGFKKSASGCAVALMLWAVVPFALFVAWSMVWDLSKFQAGWLALAFSLAALFVPGTLGRGASPCRVTGPWLDLQGVLRFHASLFGIASLAMILEEGIQLMVMAAFGWLALVYAWRSGSSWFRILGNALIAGVSIWLFVRIFDGFGFAGYRGGLAMQCWVDALVLAVVGSLVFVPSRRGEATVYWMGFLILALFWVTAVVHESPHATAWVTLLWAAAAVLALILGFILSRRLLVASGLGILLIVVGKLFIVDLASVDAGWRVALFLVLGGALLGVSYAVARIRRSETREAAASSDPSSSTDSL